MKYLLPFLLVFSIAACSASGFSNEKIRYRITVTVETPEGIKTGSAVREAARYKEPSILPDQGGVFYNITRGEAVVVDLGQRGVLFALMGRQAEAQAVFNSRSQKVTELTDLTSGVYPMLVAFQDIREAKTVYEVSGRSNMKRGRYGTEAISLENAYGQGVSIDSIVIERDITTKPEATISRYLPWLQNIKGYIDGSFAGGGPELSNILDKGDFIRSQ